VRAPLLAAGWLPFIAWSTLFAQKVDTSRSFQFQKRSQLFVRTRDETLSIAAIRVNIQIVLPSQSTAETPSGFLEIVRDDFPVLHSSTSILMIG
jgi:hypothetical protein